MGKTSNYRISAICVCLSFLLVATSAALWMRGGDGRSASAEDLSSACVKEFVAVGLPAKVTSGSGIEVVRPMATDLETQTWKASLAISRCGGLQLASFCAGQGCDKPGMSLVLKTER
jgi:hypothetical protein